MTSITHLPSNCRTDDLIEVLERDGAAIVDGFVSDTWLADFNSAIQTSIDEYKPYDYGEPEAQEFLGHRTVRLNGLVSKAPNYIDLISDERLLSVMDHFLAPQCGQYRLNSSEIIEIHGGETAQELHWDDVIWPAHFWAPNKLLQFNVMVAATDFTETNGATQVVPGSHLWDHESRTARSEEVTQATMNAGSAVLIPGKTLHGGSIRTAQNAARSSHRICWAGYRRKKITFCTLPWKSSGQRKSGNFWVMTCTRTMTRTFKAAR